MFKRKHLYPASIIILSILIILNFKYKYSNDVLDFGQRLFYPKMVFENPKIDLGIIKMGGTYSGNFTFVNKGFRSLTLSEAVPACGCTISSVPQNNFGHNAKGNVSFTLNTKELQIGPFEKIIKVKSNSRNEESLVVVTGVLTN